MRTPEQIAERFTRGLIGYNMTATVQRTMLAETIANAIKAAQPEEITDFAIQGDRLFINRRLALTGEAVELVKREVIREATGGTVYVVQSDQGDVIDVTTNKEWAEWLTRGVEDVPERSLIEETLWDGPTDRSEWE